MNYNQILKNLLHLLGDNRWDKSLIHFAQYSSHLEKTKKIIAEKKRVPKGIKKKQKYFQVQTPNHVQILISLFKENDISEKTLKEMEVWFEQSNKDYQYNIRIGKHTHILFNVINKFTEKEIVLNDIKKILEILGELRGIPMKRMFIRKSIEDFQNSRQLQNQRA